MKRVHALSLGSFAVAFAIGASSLGHANPQKWSEVQAAAKSEGKVVVAGPAIPPLRDALVAAFKKDTGIDVDWKPLVGGPGPFAAQLTREAGASAISTDVYIGGTTICFNFIRAPNAVANLKDVLMAPDVLDTSKWRENKLVIQYADPKKPGDFWCFLQLADWVMGDLFVNTRHVNPNDIKTWADILDPKYKGKIVSHDPRSPGAGRATAGYLYSLFGEDFIRKLFKDQDAALDPSYIKPGEDLARGKYWIGIALVQASVEKLRQQGLPIQRVFPSDGPGLLTGGFSGVAKLNGPNPNAGTVFVNWLASKRAQEIMQCNLMEQSRRLDLTNYDCIPDWTKPKTGVAYPIHDYDPVHHFGAKTDVAKKLEQVLGK